jgi:hypothetical protein
MVSLLVSGSAFAGISSENDSIALSSSVSKSVAAGGNQRQGQGQGQGQDQGQTQGINYAPSSYVEGVDLSKTVPAFVLPGLTAGSNPCALSVTAGGSGAGFGFGVGWVYQDQDCGVRENMRIVGGMLRANNNPNGQLVMKNIMCQSSSMWKAMELSSIEGGAKNLRCINEQPGIGSYVKLRNNGEVPAVTSKLRGASSKSSDPSSPSAGAFGY